METNCNYCPLKPEREYSLTDAHTNQDFANFIKANVTVTAYVEEIDQENNELLVRVGDILCHLPFDEVTIYSLTYSKNTQRTIPVQICTLVHNKIRVKVDYIDEGKAPEALSFDEAPDAIAAIVRARAYTVELEAGWYNRTQH